MFVGGGLLREREMKREDGKVRMRCETVKFGGLLLLLYCSGGIIRFMN